jgi:hypothetical protein
MQSDLGEFGMKHINQWDHIAFLSAMLFLSDIPIGYHPRIFFLYELGVYVCLQTSHGIVFSGLRYHVGTPPTLPPNTPPASWGTCLTAISYPPRHMDMTGCHTIAAMPGGGVFNMTPEMQDHLVPDTSYMIPSTKSNYTQDSIGLMTPCTHVSFIAQSLLWVSSLILHFLQYCLSLLNLDVDDMCLLHKFAYGELFPLL